MDESFSLELPDPAILVMLTAFPNSNGDLESLETVESFQATLFIVLFSWDARIMPLRNSCGVAY